MFWRCLTFNSLCIQEATDRVEARSAVAVVWRKEWARAQLPHEKYENGSGNHKNCLSIPICQGKMEMQTPRLPCFPGVVVSSSAPVVDVAVLEQMNTLLAAICEQNNFVYAEGTQPIHHFSLEELPFRVCFDQFSAATQRSAVSLHS